MTTDYEHGPGCTLGPDGGACEDCQRAFRPGRTYELDISFAHSKPQCARAIQLVGCEPHSSGVFLLTSTCDMQFAFDTEEQARAAQQRVMRGMDVESALVRAV